MMPRTAMHYRKRSEQLCCDCKKINKVNRKGLIFKHKIEVLNSSEKVWCPGVGKPGLLVSESATQE